MRLGRLDQNLRADASVCEDCRLGKQSPIRVLWESVIYDIDGETVIPTVITPDVLIVGEGPGIAEKALKRPLIGPSGSLLRSALRSLPNLPLTVCLTNLVLCRPSDSSSSPENREPSSDEVVACSIHLCSLISTIEPRLIVALGRLPEYYLTRFGYPSMYLIHPSAILRRGLAETYNSEVEKVLGGVR